MTVRGTMRDQGIYEIVIDAPPVNAFSIVLLRERPTIGLLPGVTSGVSVAVSFGLIRTESSPACGGTDASVMVTLS